MATLYLQTRRLVKLGNLRGNYNHFWNLALAVVRLYMVTGITVKKKTNGRELT